MSIDHISGKPDKIEPVKSTVGDSTMATPDDLLELSELLKSSGTAHEHRPDDDSSNSDPQEPTPSASVTSHEGVFVTRPENSVLRTATAHSGPESVSTKRRRNRIVLTIGALGMVIGLFSGILSSGDSDKESEAPGPVATASQDPSQPPSSSTIATPRPSESIKQQTPTSKPTEALTQPNMIGDFEIDNKGRIIILEAEGSFDTGFDSTEAAIEHLKSVGSFYADDAATILNGDYLEYFKKNSIDRATIAANVIALREMLESNDGFYRNMPISDVAAWEQASLDHINLDTTVTNLNAFLAVLYDLATKIKNTSLEELPNIYDSDRCQPDNTEGSDNLFNAIGPSTQECAQAVTEAYRSGFGDVIQWAEDNNNPTVKTYIINLGDAQERGQKMIDDYKKAA